jgi:hypothetical protein
MLALTDEACARLLIAATAVPPSQFDTWINDVANRLEGCRPLSDSKGARAVRRHRERLRNGVRRVLVSVSDADEDLLRHKGFLRHGDVDDRAALGKAVEKLLAVLRHL